MKKGLETSTLHSPALPLLQSSSCESLSPTTVSAKQINKMERKRRRSTPSKLHNFSNARRFLLKLSTDVKQ
ncbi:hypothetical protein Y032_0221g2571 [Ancylostoma ceylanicum]|uniref:Uncharacterized protein n=1 Tax=Ancylostoma ceylanicum TaxID=53326 RepID=A0A016SI23_9BILA|nr:hypothetical protein Y032_0221g2571 [Ancylostoma ceylanicum]